MQNTKVNLRSKKSRLISETGNRFFIYDQICDGRTYAQLDFKPLTQLFYTVAANGEDD